MSNILSGFQFNKVEWSTNYPSDQLLKTFKYSIFCHNLILSTCIEKIQIFWTFSFIFIQSSSSKGDKYSLIMTMHDHLAILNKRSTGRVADTFLVFLVHLFVGLYGKESWHPLDGNQCWIFYLYAWLGIVKVHGQFKIIWNICRHLESRK